MSSRVNRFKRRGCRPVVSFVFRYGNHAILPRLQTRVEGIYLRVVKRTLRRKKKYFKKNIALYTFSYWVRYSRNIFLSKKSKNSRMGSGKGATLRKAFILYPNRSFLEFKRYNYFYVSALAKVLMLKLPFRLYSEYKFPYF